MAAFFAVTKTAGTSFPAQCCHLGKAPITVLVDSVGLVEVALAVLVAPQGTIFIWLVVVYQAVSGQPLDPAMAHCM
eukprot:4672204-Ditylum_brightwellii.AAC.1